MSSSIITITPGHHVWKSQANDESLAKNYDLEPRERFVLWGKNIRQGAPLWHYPPGRAILPVVCQGAAILTQPQDRSECLFISTEHN